MPDVTTITQKNSKKNKRMQKNINMSHPAQLLSVGF